jgi:short-subunit dehydrogenase
MRDLSGALVLLTGGSRGIGPRIAARFGAAGARLALVARTAAALEQVAADLRARGVEARAFVADVTDEAQVTALLERVRVELGDVDVLVSNAGVEGFGHFEGLPFEGQRRVIELNLVAPLRLARLLVPGMLARGRGHLAFVSSSAGLMALPFGATYSASKAGVTAFAHSLRLELAGRGVSASAILPAFVEGAGMFEEQQRITGGARPPKLLGTTNVEAVAGAVLCSVQRDVPELIVNPRPMRISVGLGKAIPRFGLWLVAKLSGGYMRRLADALQASERA